MAVDAVLARLDGVRRSPHGGDDGWIAKCPAHEDRSPSLSVRDRKDGMVLLHCFAGCTAAQIVAAAHIDWRDLFPPSTTEERPLRWHEGRHGRALVQAMAHELMVCEITQSSREQHQTLSGSDLAREALAIARLGEFASRYGHGALRELHRVAK